MGKRLTAPKVKTYINWLGHVRYQEFNTCFTYDARTYELLDEIFCLLNRITPLPDSDRGIRELWLKAEVGPIEDFGDYEELHNEGQIENYEEFVEWWQAEYPSEEVWYNLTSIDDTEIGYRGIFVGNEFVIEQDPRKGKSLENDISEFVEWILECVRECIHGIENGTYNDVIERELPPQHRIGTIVRKELWDILPKLREDFFSEITEADVTEFLAITAAQVDDEKCPVLRLPCFTANAFYECCSIGYKAMGYDIEEMTPREQYERYADGRDEGLGEIDADSPEAFYEWYRDEGRFGGHPWEVCRGGNSTHIDLFVSCDEKGYYLQVAGSSVGRTMEAIKFFLALRRAGKPVCLYQAKLLATRVNEAEKIGVVPQGIIPRYCSSMFPNEKIISFMNLPFEKRDEVAGHCVWQPLHRAELMLP